MEKTNKKIMVSIWLEPKSIKMLDNLAKMGQLTRSKIIHNLIEIGYDELKLQNNIGLIKFTLLLRKFKQSIQPFLTEAEKKIIVDGKDSPKDSVSRMDSDLIEKIDSLSDKIGLTRKSFIEYVLEFEIRDVKALSSIPGFVKTSLTIRDLNETIRKNWKTNFKKTEKILETKTIELNDNSENGSD
jgi:predicted DNA-binding protein